MYDQTIKSKIQIQIQIEKKNYIKSNIFPVSTNHKSVLQFAVQWLDERRAILVRILFQFGNIKPNLSNQLHFSVNIFMYL